MTSVTSSFHAARKSSPGAEAATPQGGPGPGREAAGGPRPLAPGLSSPPGCPQQQRLAHLEEKLRLLAQARDEAQSACLQQRQTVAEAQAQASQLGLQVEGLRRRLQELQQVTRTLRAPPAVPSPRHTLTPTSGRN